MSDDTKYLLKAMFLLCAGLFTECDRRTRTEPPPRRDVEQTQEEKTPQRRTWTVTIGYEGLWWVTGDGKEYPGMTRADAIKAAPIRDGDVIVDGGTE